MASKKKKVALPEDLAIKSIEDISGDLINLQNTIRAMITQLGDAMVAKREELEAICQAIEDKKAELAEIAEQEKLTLSIQELDIELEDKKREHKRALTVLKQEFADAKNDLMREKQALSEAESQRLEDEARERRINLEDEDRAREIAKQEVERELTRRVAECERREQELGTFDERVKAEVEKQTKAMEASIGFKDRANEAKHGAELTVLRSEVDRLKKDNMLLETRLQRAEEAAQEAANRANQLALATVEAESNKRALDEVKALASEQAKGNKR